MDFFRRHGRPRESAPAQYAPPPGQPPASSRAQYAPPPGPPPRLSANRDYAPPPGPPPGRSSAHATPPPPAWTAAPERSHTDGLLSDAPRDAHDAGAAFCAAHPLAPPRLLPSAAVERIAERGCGAWGLVAPPTPSFRGELRADDKRGLSGAWRVVTGPDCEDACVLSDLPIVGGLYEHAGKRGVYFEVTVHRMEGAIAIGTACTPYPPFRMPGWNRQSAALHLDDMRKFFEDPDGGRDYAPNRTVHPGCVVGCGYDLRSGALFFTYNGARLPDAFAGLYLPRDSADVYAAIGVYGECECEVNFGTAIFAWKEGNEWAWRVEGHVGRAIGAAAAAVAGPSGEDLPAYSRR